MNFLVYTLLPLDEIRCVPWLIFCGLLIMAVVVGGQIVFNQEARMRRKSENARKDIDPAYWGSYEK